MKPINFIKPITPQEHARLIAWYRISCVLLITGLLCIVGITSKQLWETRSLTHQKSMLMPHSNWQSSQTDRNLAREEKDLKDHLATVKTWQSEQQQAHAILTAVCTCLAQAHMQLMSITLNGGRIELTAYCADPQAAVQLAQALAQTPHLQAVKLTGLQPSKSQLTLNYQAVFTARMQQT